MVVTKSHVPNPGFPPLSTSFLEQVANPLVLSALQQLTQPLAADAFAVACSGGVDSAMLALHAVVWARKQGKTLHFFHVHHGLQQRAEGWVDHVHELALFFGVPCHTVRVQVDLTQGDGLESAARTARYQAFTQLSQLTGVKHIFLGHHLDDQAETVLLRLLRGAGVTGMGAMAPLMQRDGIHYLRPLLTIPRAKLIAVAEQFAAQSQWKPVWDPTNLQDDYTRGALRDRIVPHLNERWRGWQHVLSRHAQQSQEIAELLDEIAEDDLATLDVDAASQSFDLARWRQLKPTRQALVLRHWLAKQGQKMPTQARLNDMLRQLRELHALGFDRQMRIKHGDVYVCCRRGRVFLHFDTSVS
ncbi:tRNA lysidine(34) synthetase TilS [Paenalcaligenes sp.]|uniref:tRNA lysidine(34) synthetase TilS n=1 Tax=Paenalcaligenes sp. TaxID=1966342 RepID=UPI002608E479|nr:tRNA lysidine(34) synthetase TilS [Paenalcaligenes sp.]